VTLDRDCGAVKLTLYLVYYLGYYPPSAHLLTLFVGEGLVILAFPLLKALSLLLDL
jgi:hypothetical protein